MANSGLISKIEKYVKVKMKDEPTGHDWFHVERVYKTATHIAASEKDINLQLIQAAALLHDIGDWKVNATNKTEEEILNDACDELKITDDLREQIIEIITKMSFSKNLGNKKNLSLEGKIVQDADRLEAIGAIGIARAFAYGGKKNRVIYDPSIKPQSFTNTKSYRNSKSTTINHFYEKLFLLKRDLNTATAKKIASKREKFMKNFLKEFYSEWNGNS